MIDFTVGIYSIRDIESEAGKAHAAGKPRSECPYLFGSTAGFVWRRYFDQCVDRSAAPIRATPATKEPQP